MLKGLTRDLSTKVGRDLLAYILPIGWFCVLAYSGAGADFIQISRPKKIALTIGTLVGAAIWMAIAAPRRKVLAVGCLIPWALLMMMMIAVMWFWN